MTTTVRIGPAPTIIQEAETLLAHFEDFRTGAAWAVSWANLAENARWPCYGFPGWGDWAKAVEQWEKANASVIDGSQWLTDRSQYL